jgi:hypothetical protein
MKKSIKSLAISGAIVTGLIAPSVSLAAEVPAVPNTNAAVNTGVSTEPMKVVKVKASKNTPAKKTPAKKTQVKKATAKKASKKAAAKRTTKKRVRRSLVRK